MKGAHGGPKASFSSRMDYGGEGGSTGLAAYPKLAARRPGQQVASGVGARTHVRAAKAFKTRTTGLRSEEMRRRNLPCQTGGSEPGAGDIVSGRVLRRVSTAQESPCIV